MNTEVLACKCVSLQGIAVKIVGAAAAISHAGFMPVPFSSREAGAQYQDRRYGKGLRLHNKGFSKGKHVTNTCTVCGDVKRV